MEFATNALLIQSAIGSILDKKANKVFSEMIKGMTDGA